MHSTGAGADRLREAPKAPPCQELKVAGQTPIVVRSFNVPQIPGDKTIYYSYTTNVDTQYPTNMWSAVVAGFQCDGDIYESDFTKPLIKARVQRMTNSPNWNVIFGMSHQSDPLSNIVVDVMFIRRELTDDNR